MVDAADRGGVHHLVMGHLPRRHGGSAGVALDNVGTGYGLAFRPAGLVLGHRVSQVHLRADDVGGDRVDAVGEAVAEAYPFSLQIVKFSTLAKLTQAE